MRRCYHLRLTETNPAVCPVRTALAKKFEDAIALVTKAKQAHDDLNAYRAAPQGALISLAEALTQARERARESQHALDAHVKEHNCGA